MSITPYDLLLLARIPGITSKGLHALGQTFQSAEEVARAPLSALARGGGIQRRAALAILRFFHSASLSSAEQEARSQIERARENGVRILTCWDQEYPSNLRRISDPPVLLFVRGEFEKVDDFSVAVVGTRKASPYGIHMAEEFATGLARCGLPVVSGLARGIDTVAHTSALAAGGRTLAVIGSGIDIDYPPENRTLARRVSQNGALLSEYEMGTKPSAANFPRRNRIISGITLASLIIETPIDGGAMITASCARDEKRQLFAVPSPAGTIRASGTNCLIKEGKALLVETVEDILGELHAHLQGLPLEGRKVYHQEEAPHLEAHTARQEHEAPFQN
jgi:DNA processing protein